MTQQMKIHPLKKNNLNFTTISLVVLHNKKIIQLNTNKKYYPSVKSDKAILINKKLQVAIKNSKIEKETKK